ncbi:DNA-binding transcriptional ArsR family regulator [Paenochrobactrum gallinarii]|uniref:DNA-binding transcriptional ArsR family regulator n=1 Tax=Paenochrobactrum gallinarii TaxID=643673 RepID=A0A841M5F9_9HYPH|nr:winged helix-turn-helix domain-containing protein [Paenochrobactrum gallinarii]MBB6261388.1 DNA-binding transcriptional ArsR family regulator [Paenochrobactrum gallinarii]
MSEGPNIARIAALVADPARSAMLLGLMDGRALTATELANLGGITKQTASSHLAKLVDGYVVSVETQGRHRYFKLAGEHVASLLEALMVFSHDSVMFQPAKTIRTGPKDLNLRKARICYDHLAGEMGVKLYDHMLEHNWLHDDLSVSAKGWDMLAQIGISQNTLPLSNRPLCRVCLDWSQRRHHLAGRIGKAVLDQMIALAWARRLPSSRVISFTPEGERRFFEWLK